MTEQPPQQTAEPEYYQEIAAVTPTVARFEPSLPLGIVGGILAAVVGGIVWAIIVVQSGYELGFVAWGIGALAGYVVLTFARGGGVPLQVTAVLCAGLGIVLGKYVAFVHELRVVFTEMLPGEEQMFGYVTSDSFRAFRESLGDVFSAYDLLWVGLAVVSAWRIAQASAGESSDTV